jgi:hypothetical protein
MSENYTTYIRGEYWIQESGVDFADGDIGERNHEGIAIEYVVSQYSDAVEELAKRLKIKNKIKNYEYAVEEVIRVLDLAKSSNRKNIESWIINQIGCDVDTYNILLGGGDAREYVMEHYGWIAVRSNNVELYGYTNDKQKQIADGIYQILDEEGIEGDIDPTQIDLSLFDYKTSKSWYATLADLEQPEVAARPQQQAMTTYNPLHATFFSPKDREENKYPVPQKSKENPWKTALGAEPWRVSSEGFREWLINNS